MNTLRPLLLACGISTALTLTLASQVLAQNGLVDVDVSKAKYVRIIPEDYKLPVTRQEYDRESKEKRYPLIESATGQVGLTAKQSLDLHFDQTDVLEADLSCLDSVPDERLRKLTLECHLLKAEQVKKLKRFSNLSQLTLFCVDADMDAIIAACPQLGSLELCATYEIAADTQGDVYADATLKKVGKLNELRAFRINAHKLSDQAIEHLHDLSRLESLDLMDSKCFTNNATKSLAKCRSLREVGITMNRSLTFEGLAPLADLPKLERLWLADGEAFFNTAPKELQAKFKHVLIKTKP